MLWNMYLALIVLRPQYSCTVLSVLASDDFVAQTNQQITFEPGSSLQIVDVEVVNDEVLENSEYFFGTITSSTLQVLLDQSITSVNITDDDSES